MNQLFHIYSLGIWWWQILESTYISGNAMIEDALETVGHVLDVHIVVLLRYLVVTNT